MNSLDDLKHNLTEEKIHNQKVEYKSQPPTRALSHTLQPSNGAISRGPSPNRGASVSDVEAIGPDSDSKRAWQKKRGIDTAKQVRIVKVSHMRYQHPDLNKITTFLRGMPPLPCQVSTSHVRLSNTTRLWHARGEKGREGTLVPRLRPGPVRLLRA